ncbi:hypothetical protein DS901_11465 [Loktanella sp. D2R18]|uniref:DUF2254 domain-containing protein n=1 Tax=Rhodobacterales TaxID=204455 RepID=UPI000DEA75D2|nr:MULTISPECIES: DUF2254 domain-containing protein [Rhodobacterales]MDO6590336.1 DUF2254 domain-containing protein [Yoonia sp. 1_MG-2023]RBW42861.1 hypothetical protein DS901_11465 [Loktanella sp. D2R18]
MGKRAQLLKILQDIRASYWFLPTVLVFLGLFLAAVMAWVDRHAGSLPISLPKTFIDTQAEGARTTLAVIAQAIIGVTGVTFSMTLVAVSFASGNYGPRLVGNFMRDRGNQLCLGVLIATFVYTVIVLRSVQDSIDGGVAQYVPQYSIIMALVLTLCCVFTLIYFIHHVPETINVSRISATVGLALDRQLRDLIDRQPKAAPVTAWPNGRANTTLTASTSGYIQTCNFERLTNLATDNDWFIRMRPSIGDFLTQSTVVFEIWSDGDLTGNEKNCIMDCYAVGFTRTENQNPTFLAEQLVEMIARALSPGVNDPYTAMDCLNRLSAALTLACGYHGGLSPAAVDRVDYPRLSFYALFAASFPQCRQYVTPDAITRKHAISLLDHLHDTARPQDQSVIKAERDALKP